MNKASDLTELMLKYKQYSRLNKSECEIAREKLRLAFLQPDNLDSCIEYMFSLPSEVSASAFRDAWQAYDDSSRVRVVDKYVKHNQFQSEAGYNRTIELISHFAGVSVETSTLLLNELGRTLTNDATAPPSQKPVARVRKELMSEDVLLLDQSGSLWAGLTDAGALLVFYGIACEESGAHENGSLWAKPFLSRLAKAKRKLPVVDKVTKDLERKTAKWPEELQRIALDLGYIRTIITSLKNAPDLKSGGQSNHGGNAPAPVPAAAEESRTIMTGTLSVRNRPGEVAETLKRVRHDIDRAVAGLEDERQARVFLEERIRVLENENNETMQRVKALQELLRQTQSRNLELESELTASRERLDSETTRLLEMVEKRSELAATQTKNRIGQKLVTDYADFTQIESEKMTTGLGENLRAQLRTIFRLLADEGISLK